MVWAATALACLSAAGCNGTIEPPRPVQRIDVIHLRIGPPASRDDEPGPDGIEVQVSFYRLDEAPPKMVLGELDLMMYEGRVSGAALIKTKPLKTWAFTGDQLTNYVIRPLGLWGYGMTLLWGRQRPGSPTITFVARYRAEGAETVYSKPSLISLSAR